MIGGTGNVPEVGLVLMRSQHRSRTRTPMHSPLTSHRKGPTGGAAGSTGRKYSLPERPGGHRNSVRSENSARGSDSGCPPPQGGGADPELTAPSPGARVRGPERAGSPRSSHRCFHGNKRALRGQERVHPGQARGQGLAGVGADTTVTHLRSFTHFTFFSP